MKIIRRGIPAEDQTFRALCKTCKSEIEFERKEAKEIYNSQGLPEFLHVVCPVCCVSIYVGL